MLLQEYTTPRSGVCCQGSAYETISQSSVGVTFLQTLDRGRVTCTRRSLCLSTLLAECHDVV